MCRFGNSFRLTLAVTVVVMALSTGCAQGSPRDAHATTTPKTGDVAITGDVYSPTTLSLIALQKRPLETHSVAFETREGTRRHRYTGCRLEALLSEGRPRPANSDANPFLTIAVVATGADGYAAVLSWAELTRSDKSVPAMVALTEDGAPLAQPRLVVPSDTSGARHVKDLVGLRVVQLGAPSSPPRQPRVVRFHR